MPDHKTYVEKWMNGWFGHGGVMDKYGFSPDMPHGLSPIGELGHAIGVTAEAAITMPIWGVGLLGAHDVDVFADIADLVAGGHHPNQHGEETDGSDGHHAAGGDGSDGHHATGGDGSDGHHAAGGDGSDGHHATGGDGFSGHH